MTQPEAEAWPALVRSSLVQQTVAVLRDRCGQGAALPPERRLAAELQVSRSTLRKALAHLRKTGMIETQPRSGSQSCAKAARLRHARPSVEVLLHTPPERGRHFGVAVLHHLAQLLRPAGIPLRLHLAGRARGWCRKLVRSHLGGQWLLMDDNPRTQEWFRQQNLPTLVSGTCQQEVDLPYVCLDNFALGRHAAGLMKAAGHRHIGLLLTRRNPYLREGLWAGLSAHPELTLVERAVSGPPEQSARCIRSMMQRQEPPTVIFCAESALYLSACCELLRLGYRIPEEVSLICRDDEPFLEALQPPPARYTKCPQAYALALHRLLTRMRHGECLGWSDGCKILPTFQPADSLRRK